VLVPADAIPFVRPRVDAVATVDSVHDDQGFIGKLTDALLWVGEPDFEATGTDVTNLDGYAFRVEGDAPSCEVAQDAYCTPTPADAESR
jgi:hypothetical protein